MHNIPVRTAPAELESISSWAARSALNVGAINHAFSRAYWRGVQVWNRDFDVHAPEIVIRRLAELCRCPYETAFRTTVRSLEGIVFEHWVASGQPLWVIRAGIYHRTRRRSGQQYCPQCLATDREPYYRLTWRLAFITTCPRHSRVLLDACPHCQRPVVFHRAADAYESMTLCAFCGGDLAAAPGANANPSVVELQGRFESAMRDRWGVIDGAEPMLSILYFKLLRQLMRLVSTGPRSGALRQAIERRYGIPDRPFEFSGGLRTVECLSSADRYRLVESCAPLLWDWPNNFLAVMRDASMWQSWVLRDVEDQAPYLLWRVVKEHLFKPMYKPNGGEIASAVHHLKGRRIPATPTNLRRILGVESVRYRSVIDSIPGAAPKPMILTKRQLRSAQTHSKAVH